jgi:hypothetical protein
MNCSRRWLTAVSFSFDVVFKIFAERISGDSELYWHPSLDEFNASSTRDWLKCKIRPLNDSAIELIRYQDL